jgi:hypothetical protein
LLFSFQWFDRWKRHEARLRRLPMLCIRSAVRPSASPPD